jgi:hypothetical protein
MSSHLLISLRVLPKTLILCQLESWKKGVRRWANAFPIQLALVLGTQGRSTL